MTTQLNAASRLRSAARISKGDEVRWFPKEHAMPEQGFVTDLDGEYAWVTNQDGDEVKVPVKVLEKA